MSSARLSGEAPRAALGADRIGPVAGAAPRSPAPGWLAGALLVVCLYAAFAHGAVSASADERVQLALGTIAAVAAAGWLWSGTLVLRAPTVVWTALALLAGFAIWSGVTLAWSVSPDQTWIECNRAITYTIVLALAIALGASHPRALSVVAHGFLAVCLVVTAYGLGQKLVPGLHIGGLINLDQTAALPRLQEPFGYWNAMALFVAMGVPIALALAVERRRPAWVRLGALAAVVLMAETIAFTYSRGGVLALVVALAAGIGFGGVRLRWLMWLGLAGVASLPPVVIGLESHKLTAAGVALGAREQAGAELAVVLAACLLLLVLAARRLIELERRVRVSRLQARRIARMLAGLAAVVIIAAVLAVALSSRGLGGTVSHAWSSFTATRAAPVNDPSRLLSADSENRWVWWKEAAGAFSDRPIGGWGAGSFSVVHLLYRRDTLSVQQPHSVPLQFLAETGLIGASLALGAGALLIAGAVGTVRRRTSERERLLAAALLAGAVAYAVHELYDWDWNIPGVTIPALVFLGVLGGSLGLGERGRRLGGLTRPRRLGLRVLALTTATLGISAFALSVVVPQVAASEASQAILTASNASGARLRQALATALSASRLDPLSDAGLKAASTIAIHLGRRRQARRYLLAAVGRNPTDGQAWQELAFEDFATGDDREGLVAVQRARALDPQGRFAVGLAQAAMLTLAPPADSATAVSTPPTSASAVSGGGGVAGG